MSFLKKQIPSYNLMNHKQQSGGLSRARVIFWLLAALYSGLWWTLTAFPFLDMPNHFARAWIMSDLLFNQGREWGQHFFLAPVLSSYILADLTLASLIAAFKPAAAGSIWLMICQLSLPAAIGVYLRTIHYPRAATWLVLMLSLYLATDWFFLLGFHAYRLTIALVFLALAALEKYIRGNSWYFLPLLMCLLAIYFTHAFGILYVAIAAVVICALRVINNQLSVKSALVCLGPVAVIPILHVLLSSATKAREATIVWRSVEGKLLGFLIPFMRFNYFVDAVILLFLLAILVTVAIHHRSVLLRRDWPALEPLAIALVCVLAYLAMPIGMGFIYDIDDRALPVAYIFFLIWVFRPVLNTRAPLIGAVAVVVCANFMYLAERLITHNNALIGYNAVAEHVPAGAMILPIATVPSDGRLNTSANAGSLAAVKRHAITPQLFAGGTGFPMKYFLYRKKLYTTDIFWYIRHQPIDWVKVDKAYDYLLVSRPYDPERIAIGHSVIFQNESAALLRINHAAPFVVRTLAHAGGPLDHPAGGPQPRQ